MPTPTPTPIEIAFLLSCDAVVDVVATGAVMADVPVCCPAVPAWAVKVVEVEAIVETVGVVTEVREVLEEDEEPLMLKYWL